MIVAGDEGSPQTPRGYPGDAETGFRVSTATSPLILLLALLVVGIVAAFLPNDGTRALFFGVALVAWGLVPLAALSGAATLTAALANWRPLVFYAILAVPATVFARPDLSGTLLAPLALVMLATLLGQHDTSISARSWVTWIGWSLWALCGVVSLALLAQLPEASAPAIVLLVALVGYNAARRAVLIQGRRPQWAHFAAVIVAALGASLVSQPAEAPLHLFGVVLGLVLFFNSEHLLPPASSPWPAAAINVHHQIACVAPVMLIFIWLLQFALTLGG